MRIGFAVFDAGGTRVAPAGAAHLAAGAADEGGRTARNGRHGTPRSRSRARPRAHASADPTGRQGLH